MALRVLHVHKNAVRAEAVEALAVVALGVGVFMSRFCGKDPERNVGIRPGSPFGGRGIIN